MRGELWCPVRERKRSGESGDGARVIAMGNDDFPSVGASPTLLLVADVEETIRFLQKV